MRHTRPGTCPFGCKNDGACFASQEEADADLASAAPSEETTSARGENVCTGDPTPTGHLSDQA